MSGRAPREWMVRELYEGSRPCRVSYTDEGVQWTYYLHATTTTTTTTNTTTGSGRGGRGNKKDGHHHHQDNGITLVSDSRAPPLPGSAFTGGIGGINQDGDEDCGGSVPFHEVIAVTEQDDAIVRTSERNLNGSKRSASVHPLFVLQREACSQLETNGSGPPVGGARDGVRTMSDSKYTEDREGSFTIHYIKHYSGDILGTASVTFQGPVRHNREFAKAVRDRMKISQNRPKHFLAFVSPKSGKNKGVKIFRNTVRPIFELAGIKVTELITERQMHAVDHLQTCDLSGFDGIISVGGDGMYSEVMNGLVLRTQKDAGVDHNTPEACMQPCNIPIGIIPAGSGDVLCMFLYGTRDPETAALHIIKGYQTSTNIYSVHYGHKLACYCGLILGFGFSGFIMHNSNKHRWMGPSRYVVTILLSMIKHAFYKINVRYTQDDLRSKESPAPTIDDVKWANINGEFHSVDSWVITLAKDGELLTPLFGDSTGSVVMINKCGRLQHMKYMGELYKMKSVCYENNFITVAKTKNYHLRFHQTQKKRKSSKTGSPEPSNTLPHKTYLNCDGNSVKVHSNDFNITVIQNVVTLFGREKEMTVTKL